MAKPKIPRDTNQRAKSIVDIATGETEDNDSDKDKNQSAVELGRKGGKARAKNLTAEECKEIAKKAAEKRWKKKD